MEKLQKWGSDASSIFEGDQLFFDIPVHKDDVYGVRSTDLKNLLSGLCGNTMQQSHKTRY
jgi:hypothetical protein